MSYKTLHRELKILSSTNPKGSALKCSRRVSNSCSTINTRRVTFKRHEHLLIFKLCANCDKLYLNIIDHLLVSCDRIRDKRDDF